MPATYLGLGSNLGDRLDGLCKAVAALADYPEVVVDYRRGIASLYETIPQDVPHAQPKFLNSAIRVVTSLLPHQLLAITQSVERKLGRVRRRKFEARPIDIDILLWGDQVIDESFLTIPHPRLHERRFVLEPLAEIVPTGIHPTHGATILCLAASLRPQHDDHTIKRIAGPGWARLAPMAAG